MEDPNVTRDRNASDVQVRPLQAAEPGAADAAQPPASDVQETPQPPSAASPPEEVNIDSFLSDAERRQKLEMELRRLGMSPTEVRRLLDADSTTTDPLKQSAAGPSPLSRAATPPSAQARPQIRSSRPTADSIESYAAQLVSARAAAQVKAVEQAELNLPAFRESSLQEVRQAEQLLRDAAMLRRRERFADAESKCREALNLVPKDGAALEMLGDLLQGVARIDEALAAYKRAVEADPKRSAAERKYGELLMKQQQWNGPDPEAAPKNPLVAVLLSLVLPGLGQFHNGEIGKGVLFLLLDAVCYYLLALSPYGFAGEHARHTLNLSLIGCITLAAVVYLAAVIDTNIVARFGGRRRGGSGWDV